MRNSKTRLALGVASAAFVAGIASPASAACTVEGSTVTCSTDSTAAEVNAAMAAAGGSDVTLQVADDVEVLQPGSPVSPTQQGDVSISNAGDLGTDVARVDVFYAGTSSSATNTFDLDNSGTISGSVSVFNVGGATSIVNSGLIGNGVTVFTNAVAPISFASTGDIQSDADRAVLLASRGEITAVFAGDVGTAATATTDSDLRDIVVISDQPTTIPATSETVTSGTATTTTNTGGTTDVGGPVSVEIAQGANTGSVAAIGLESASLTVDGNIGSETEFNYAYAESQGQWQTYNNVTTVDGADSSYSYTNQSTALGGTADIAIGEAGSVSGGAQAIGLAGASVSVDGVVGSEADPAGVSAISSGIDRTTVSSGATVDTLSTASYTDDTTSVGGLAQVTVGATGVVTGGIYADGVGGASVAIAGIVGLEDQHSGASANSTGRDTIYSQQSSFDSATGDYSFSQDYSDASNGGDASIDVGTDGVLYGSANAYANGDATISNAGQIADGANATAQGYAYASSYDYASDATGYSESSTQESADTGGSATITNAAGGLMGEEPTAPVNVYASGDTSATVANSGRINGNVIVESSALSHSEEDLSSSSTTTAPTTMVVTTVNVESAGYTDTNLGGDAAFTNAAGGLVTGFVDVRGTGSASVTNSGAVIGTTYVASQASDSGYAYTETLTNVFTPGVDGGTVATDVTTQAYNQTTSGGDVTGVYAGTNGAVQFAPFGGASDGSVTQQANGDSTAIVSGTIFGNFTGTAAGSDYGWTFDYQSTALDDADGDRRSFDDSYTYDETDRESDSDSTLAVNGGTITGNASLYATGSASAQLGNGASIGGSLSVTAQGFGGYDYAESRERSFAYDEDGVFTGNTSAYAEELQRIANTGDVSVSIGEATVGGSVNLSGAAGTNTFTLSQDGAVGGSVFQASNYSVFAYDLTRVTESTPTTTQVTTDYAQSNTAAGGDVTATVAGSIGNGVDNDPLEYGDVASAGGTSLSLNTNAGDASAIVTGQVRNGIRVIADGEDTTYAYQQTDVNGVTTDYAQQSTSTATGGTATLVVDASDLDTPANFGDIVVSGRSGSSATIGADSSVLAATNGAFMQVGGYFADTASTLANTYTAGVLTGQVETYSTTTVGGPASLVNDGRIGYDGGADYSGDDAFVLVESPTSAEATNNGWIFGSISVDSLFEDYASTTTRTNMDDVTRVDTTDRTYTAGGGSAELTNNGLITGDAYLAAIDGLVTNNGVLRGDLELGARVDNYTTRSVDTLTQIGEEEALDLAEALEQGYAVEQNGLLGGTISVAGAFGYVDDEIQTSNITAVIDLNSGSVTGGGVIAEYDEETGERYTATTVNLNGAGYLGLGDAAIDQLEDAFGDIDPQIELAGDLSAYAGGARVLGVDLLNKTGAGVFLITGADYGPLSNTNRVADYTLDVGSFTINGGEIQLATASEDGVFGIRGDTLNNAGLVLGSRVTIPAPLFGTNATVQAIDGVEVYQNGDFTQSGTGTLTVGVTPTLVRVFDPAYSSVSLSTNPLAVQQIGLASGLFTTPENAFGQAFADLGTGFLTLDGDLNLGGKVQLVSPTGGLFTDGQTVDIASVSGAVTATADVVVNNGSSFVTFDLGTRTAGGRTIVFASADRAGYETVGDNQNAIAAGTALSAALPGVVARIRAGSTGGIGLAGDQFVLAQDLANIFVGFDTLLTMDEVTTALNELASGEFYGSLTTLSTTAPFVDAISSPRVSESARGFNLWLAPSGDFVKYDGSDAVGSNKLHADNYGMSGGFGVATGNGEIGMGFGYGRISADARSNLLQATADTWMVGAYVRQAFGALAVGADVVYGWSDWSASRIMPTMSRTALAEFDSNELRGNLRAEYMLDFSGAWVAPFGQVELRKYNFDSFTEEGAGAVNLVVQDADDTVITPTVGARAGTSFETGMATLRPEVTLAYSFQGNNNSFRDVAYLGAADIPFRLQGVDPDGFFTIGAGLFADIGKNSGAFLRGSFATGSDVNVASINAGVTIGF